MGFACTCKPSRNAIAAGPFTTSASVVPPVLPIGGWKKHGRTSPFGSSTAETHGALQRGAEWGTNPQCARK